MDHPQIMSMVLLLLLGFIAFTQTAPQDCPQNTQLVEGCCQPCIVCGDGFMKIEDECLSPCIPCDYGTWRTDEFDQTYCLPCMDCGLMYRACETECTRIKDSICGKCQHGYHENIFMTGEDWLMDCLKCGEYSGVKECDEYLNITEDITNKEGLVGAVMMPMKEPSIVLPLLVLVIGVAASVLLVIVFRSRRRLCSPSSNVESPQNDRGKTGAESARFLDGNITNELEEINDQPEGTVPNGWTPRQEGSLTDTQESVCLEDFACGRSICSTSDADGAGLGVASPPRHWIPLPGVVTESSLQ